MIDVKHYHMHCYSGQTDEARHLLFSETLIVANSYNVCLGEPLTSTRILFHRNENCKLSVWVSANSFNLG